MKEIWYEAVFWNCEITRITVTHSTDKFIRKANGSRDALVTKYATRSRTFKEAKADIIDFWQTAHRVASEEKERAYSKLECAIKLEEEQCL